ncbi:MAG TPA: UDP-2,4-diacetamido-2,4,6-trideoxy-beta-L-altropyranose hydrolase [Gemmataceae bacterium]|nr:UDP-2,4-diacetamido-2,4,6-trideoxy-beta-L-altropyranose hydrolase [Gemmataceae bacterium]
MTKPLREFGVRNLLVRADADVRIGTGHVMRCLALTQAWQNAGGQVIFASACLAPGLEARLAEEHVDRQTISAQLGTEDDARETIALARRLEVASVVLDGYHFCGRYQQAIKQAGLCLLVIDDCRHAEHYWADLVLNQNLHAAESMYRQREPNTRLLLGTRFALLRREFWKWRGWKRATPALARKVLVTLGGSDPDNVTGKVIQALQQVSIEGLQAIVVAGASNPHRAELEAAVAEGGAAIRLRATVKNMSALMAWADVAIAAGGTTSWERALMGLPSLVVILADNQRDVAHASEQVGIGWNLGPHQQLSVPVMAATLQRLLQDPEARARMAQRGTELVDGLGAARVVGELLNLDVCLRPVAPEDCRLIWEWVNESAVRATSFAPETISWERHQEWFAAKLNDPACAFFIALNGTGVPIGQVRGDVEGNVAIVSVSVDPRFRGSGYGTQLIRKGSERLFERANVDRIHAFIRQGNEASHRAFEKAGYREVEVTVVRGYPANLLELRK